MKKFFKVLGGIVCCILSLPIAAQNLVCGIITTIIEFILLCVRGINPIRFYRDHGFARSGRYSHAHAHDNSHRMMHEAAIHSHNIAHTTAMHMHENAANMHTAAHMTAMHNMHMM